MFDMKRDTMEAEKETVAVLSATCGCCGETTEYPLSDEEYKTYMLYQVYGRQMGMLQDLFPNIPNWIRSGAIDQFSGGFCICPKCCG